MSERSPANTVLVVLLRRDSDSLAEDEMKTILNSFPDHTVKFVRTDPRDFVEHDADCRRFKGQGWARVIGYLPKEKPIPSLAMENGTPHVLVIDGKLMRLQPLVPQFEPFA